MGDYFIFFFNKKKDWNRNGIVTLEHKGKMNTWKKNMVRRERKDRENRVTVVRWSLWFHQYILFCLFFLPAQKKTGVLTYLCKTLY